VERALLILIKERLIQETGQLADPSLKPIREIGIVREFLKQAGFILGKESSGTAFPERIWHILQTVATGSKHSEESAGILSQLEEILQDMQAEFDPEIVSGQDYWQILEFLLQSSHHYPEREAEERPVSGWLELPWERAPHLVVLGLPDSKVPGNDGTDAFLTASLCRQLGLYGPDETAAFHAFRLRLIMESRRDWGKLDILLPDRGLDDDPELPSRFLFLSGEAGILDRVDLLLGERPSTESAIAADFGGNLAIPGQPPLERISVTDFSAYLYSPFHYLVERGLGWIPPRELPLELDALRFGKLAHSVVEKLNGSEEGMQLSSKADIDSFMNDQLSMVIGLEFGEKLSVPVMIQANSMRERLRAAAGVISTERMAGWKPLKAEWKFTDEIDFRIDGVLLSGVIDLVERNEESGLYRVVDYKTSDRPVEAMKAHLMRPNATSAAPWFPECDFVEGDKTWRWTNLQLMMYHLAVEKALGQRPEVAYLNLAKAVKEVKLSPWHPSEAQALAAMACAEAVVRQIRGGVFPAGKGARYKDDWLPWFGGDYESGVNPDWRARHMEVEK
jgi:ATP-dependent helicase/nuclease subunit B